MKISGQSNRASDTTSSKHSLRLTFAYLGSDIRLESVKSIAMIAPPSDDPKRSKDESGFWYEVRDRDNRTLYRRITENPIKFAVEIRSDDTDAPFKWEEIKEPAGSFTLLVPDISNAQSIVLFSSPFDLKKRRETAQEIARFDLGNVKGKGAE